MNFRAEAVWCGAGRSKLRGGSHADAPQVLVRALRTAPAGTPESTHLSISYANTYNL